MFEKLIRESAGNYLTYIVIAMENERLDEVLSFLPSEKLYLLDIKPESSSKAYSGVFQNFEQDIFQALSGVVNLCRKYSKLFLVFRNQITDPPLGLTRGFNLFCQTNRFDSQIILTSLSKRKVRKGEGYIVIDDEDLVYLVEHARDTGLEIGSDLGIVSYNETPLKKIAANGISVLSTDFSELGNQMAEMVLNNVKTIKYNSFRFINRNSF